MTELFGGNYSKEDILKQVGDMSQVCGVKRYELQDGNEKGVEAVDFRTGTGFNFTVLLGRGMDIPYAEYKGMPLCWCSSTGKVSATYFEPEGLEWLRSFFGGLLTTCGLTYVGAPCTDEGKQLGIHGRISNIPAKNVYVDSEWYPNGHLRNRDEYMLWAQGKIRETSVFGENLCLSRKISAKLGESKLYIDDVVENLGFDKIEHMILYHFNLGFPLLDKDSKLILPLGKVIPRDKDAEIGKENFDKFTKPIHNFKEKVYYLDLKPDKKGLVKVVLWNDKLNLGVYIKYSKKQLDKFVEWKMTGEGTYVLGLEPSNCWVGGRDKERKKGTLKFLAPKEKKEYHLEVGIITQL